VNVKKALQLLNWVEKQKQVILADRPTRRKLAEDASKAIGFKVSDSAIRDALQEYGIETKRVSKTQSKILGLQERVRTLETLLTKLIAAAELPSWLSQELNEADLPQEARAALGRMEGKAQKVA